MQGLGENRGFLFEEKVVLISVAAVLQLGKLYGRNDAKSFLLHQSRYSIEAGFMIYILQ